MSAKSQDLLAYDRPYRLLEEARKSWNYIVSDKIVHTLQPIEVTRDCLNGVAKDYVEGNIWFESHLTFEMQGHAHYTCIVECYKMPKLFGQIRKKEIANVSPHGKPSMFVDVAERIQSPQEMTSHRALRSVIRLKRFDDIPCPCGNSSSTRANLLPIRCVQNGKVGVKRVQPIQFGEGPNKLVQRGAKAAHKIPNNQRDRVWNVRNLEADAIPLIFSISLSSVVVRLGLSENVDFFPQRIQMYLRPGCFQVWVGQCNGHNGQFYRSSVG